MQEEKAARRVAEGELAMEHEGRGVPSLRSRLRMLGQRLLPWRRGLMTLSGRPKSGTPPSSDAKLR